MSNSLATPWTVACQAPLSMEFSRKEHWSGLPCPSPSGVGIWELFLDETGLSSHHGSWNKDKWPNLRTHEDIEKWEPWRSCLHGNIQFPGPAGGRAHSPTPVSGSKARQMGCPVLNSGGDSCHHWAGPCCYLCTSGCPFPVSAPIHCSAFPDSQGLPNIPSKRATFVAFS